MPKRRPTIPISHGDADDVFRMIALTDQEWQAIEYEYGRQLNAEVRQQITTVTTQYLKDRGFERAAAPKEMARKRIERIRRAAGDLESVMLNREAFSASSPEPEPEAKTTSGGDEGGKPKEAKAIPGQLAPADTAEKSAPEEKPAETAEEKSSEPAEERGAEKGTETVEEKPAATEAEATQRAEAEEEGNQRGDELPRQQRQSAHSYADGLIRRHLDERRSRITDSALLAVVTVTDADGDTATTSARRRATGIGQAIFFQDDGPGIAQRAPRVAHDKTASIDADDTTATAVVALFNGVSNVSGDLSPTGYAQEPNPVDQEGGTTAFSLAVPAAGEVVVDSGLDTTDGTSIFLFKEGDLVVGRIGGAAGAAAFAIAINSTSGGVSVAQYASIKHPTPGARDKLRHFRHELKSLVVACDGALNDLSATENSDDEPWNWWIQALTRIAQRHLLPYRARIVEVSGEPSPFVALVCALQLVRALQEHVPARHTSSDEALAKAIQRAQGRARDK